MRFKSIIRSTERKPSWFTKRFSFLAIGRRYKIDVAYRKCFPVRFPQMECETAESLNTGQEFSDREGFVQESHVGVGFDLLHNLRFRETGNYDYGKVFSVRS